MYQESYEDYIRSILGYPNYGSHSENCCMANTYEAMPMEMPENNTQNMRLENCYPEIYKVVYPMINKACSTNTKPITEELIDELTNEIYLSIENDNEINVTINLNNEVGSITNNRNANAASSSKMSRTNNVTPAATPKPQENRGEDRQFRNRGLQDLIRILLIREFLGRPRPWRTQTTSSTNETAISATTRGKPTSTISTSRRKPKTSNHATRCRRFI